MKLFGITLFARTTKNNQVDALIGSSTQVDGGVKFTGGLRVEGQINGDVNGVKIEKADSVLILVRNAMITGSVNVNRAIIDSTVDGPLVICEHLELLPGARVKDVTYRVIKVHEGAIIDGKMTPMAEWPRSQPITAEGE
jgi:cytoskeletal protein CcmA (bactofilin family)